MYIIVYGADARIIKFQVTYDHETILSILETVLG